MMKNDPKFDRDVRVLVDKTPQNGLLPRYMCPLWEVETMIPKIYDAIVEVMARPIIMIGEGVTKGLRTILKLGECKMAEKQAIIVTDGEYKGRVFKAVIGKDVAFIEIDDTIYSIPEGHFNLFKGEKGIPMAFDESDQMFVPESIKTPTAEFLESPFMQEWPNAGWPGLDDLGENAITAEKVIKNQTFDGMKWEEDPRTIALADDNNKVRARNKALKARLDRKSESNVRQNNENNILRKTLRETEKDLQATIADRNEWKHRHDKVIEELNKDDQWAVDLKNKLDRVTAERDEYKRLNDHHREQLEIGNERREKIKETVEHLHTEIRAEKEKRQRESARANQAEAELERYKRIVDALTKKRI